MERRKAFGLASGVALVAWVGATLAAVLVACAGVVGLTGWGDYTYRLSPDVPGLSLHAGFQPSWSVAQGGEVCGTVDVRQPDPECYNLVLHREGQPLEGHVLPHGDVRPVDAVLTGRLFLDAEPGWNPLMAALYAMQVIALLVLAFVLAQLWLILRAASGGRPFTNDMVRRLRLMGWTLVAWEFVEPFLWLFLSPKALDYSAITVGPWPHLQLGSMEPGGPSWPVVGFGMLLVLLAELFRHGADLAEEQELTV